MVNQELIDNFFNLSLEKVKWEITQTGEFEPEINVLTYTKNVFSSFDINVMKIPSFSKLLIELKIEEFNEVKEIIDGFIQHLDSEGKHKIAIFQCEIIEDDDVDYLYTYHRSHNDDKVYRYKINRSNMNINNIGDITQDIDFVLIDVA